MPPGCVKSADSAAPSWKPGVPLLEPATVVTTPPTIDTTRWLPWSVKKTVAPSALTATPAALVNLALPAGPDARPVTPPANIDTEHATAPSVNVGMPLGTAPGLGVDETVVSGGVGVGVGDSVGGGDAVPELLGDGELDELDGAVVVLKKRGKQREDVLGYAVPVDADQMTAPDDMLTSDSVTLLLRITALPPATELNVALLGHPG
jgi:hypothetical protein